MINTKLDTTLKRFVEECKRYPMLTFERERDIAAAWRDRHDRKALDELVGSHLRLVLKIARGFAGYGLPLADLVAEGNVGLMQAADKFDCTLGFRFATYARWWIRAAIQEYILHSWSLVKIGTTSAQKKLFFNLRRSKARLEGIAEGELTRNAVIAIAKDLDVPEREVIEMNGRLGGADKSLNAMLNGDAAVEWIELLVDERPTQETVLGDAEEGRWRRNLLGEALKKLNSREREIIFARRLKEEPATLEELSHRYALSRERIRQIEIGAISKMAFVVTGVRRQHGATQRRLARME
jgi:RNA polymerase sigma-32 factor